MAGRGPAPKPANIRQRTNQKAGNTQLAVPVRPKVPEIPNPDGRVWHPLTLQEWDRAWQSPMASQWLPTDTDALGRLAVLWDDFNQRPHVDVLKEIRLQSALFGLSPLDRSRLQWEVARGDDAQQKRQPKRQPTARTGTNDPRAFLVAVK